MGKQMIALFVLLASPSWAQDETEQPQDPPGGPVVEPEAAPSPAMEFTFEGDTIKTLTTKVQRMTNYKFHWSNLDTLDTVRINYIATEGPTTPEQWFELYVKILYVNGFTIIPIGDPEEKMFQVKLLEGAKAGVQGKTPTIYDVGTTFPIKHEVISYYIGPIKYIQTSQAVALISNMRTQSGVIAELQSAKLILITDYDNVIKRMSDIIAKADVALPPLALIIKQIKKHAATELKDLITSMKDIMLRHAASGGASGGPAPVSSLPGAGGPGTGPVRPTPPTTPGTTSGTSATEEVLVEVDKITNSIIIYGQEGRVAQIAAIIDQIESQIGERTYAVFVYRLRHGIALDIEYTLRAVLTGQSQSASSASPTIPGGASPSLPRSGGGGSSADAGDIVKSLTGEFVPILARDDPSNSIIVVTTQGAWKDVVEPLIVELDRRRPQVYLKCTVVEIRATETFDLGVELSKLTAPNNGATTVGGRTDFGQSVFADVDGDGLLDVIPAVLPGGSLFVFHDRLTMLAANLHALEGVQDVRIIEEPELIARDNRLAQINVKVQVPVTTTTFAATGSFQTTFDHFEDASTILTITPHISENSYVQLELEILVEKFTGVVAASAAIPPPKTSRKIITAPNVPDRHTVVVGGLITNDENDSERGVPWLWKIPVLGHLFRRDEESNQKTTLYVFITPTIMNAEAFGIEGVETRKRKTEIEDHFKRPLPQLTPWPPAGPRFRSTFDYHTTHTD